MKKVIANLSWKNWNKKPGNILTTVFGVVSLFLSLQDEFLGILHDAPFPVSDEVDKWVKWLLKVAIWFLGFLMLLSRKRDIDIRVTDATSPANTSPDKN